MSNSCFYDPSLIQQIKDSNVVIDTSVLAICSTDTDFLTSFEKIFNNTKKLINPIVKLEFLRGAQTDSLYAKKEDFLKFHDFFLMQNDEKKYIKVYENAFHIARIYSHHKKEHIKLGDVFIIARLMLYPQYLFITLDKGDFTSLLFDRIGVITIEHNTPNNKSDTLELVHICLLKFNKNKFKSCVKKLSHKEE